MKNKNEKIVTISFLILLFGLFFANLFSPDQELSYSERRRLAQLPKLSVKEVFNAEYMKAFDKYATDQFIGREPFRGVKTFVDRNIFLKRDTNRLFQVDGSVFSIEYPLHEDKVLNLCGKLGALYDRYLDGMNVYYTVIPDKNYHLPADGSGLRMDTNSMERTHTDMYLRMDYERLEELMLANMPSEAKYIDLFGTLSLSNYYMSDGHWRQETLKPVVDKLYGELGISMTFDPSQYEERSYEPFYGAYYGQLAGMAKPDTIIWLENYITRDAIVTSLGHPGREDLPIYYEEGLKGMDAYDVFLYGAQPLITLDNPHNTSGRELILVRDSFGSSIAPLLLEAYSRIIIVDLRYITQELLADYITFENQDVLCMFSTIIINNSDIIR